MKESKYDGSVERKVLIGMITDDRLLGSVASKFRRDLFESKWANLISSWCVSYFRKYEKAPQKDIENLFAKWARKNKDEKLSDMIEKFIVSLSDEYEKGDLNVEHLLDTAADYFNQVRLQKLADQINGSIESGEVSEALEAQASFSPLQLGQGAWVDVLTDLEASRLAHDVSSEPLITYPGALGKFFGSNLERDAFVAFQGSQKRGKSFALIDIVWQGVKQNCRVAYYVVGDMSRGQVMKRLHARAARHPYRIPGGFPGTIEYPVKLWHPDKNEPVKIKYKKDHFDKPLTWRIGFKAFQKVAEASTVEGPPLKLACYPSLGITVDQITADQIELARNGWVADIIVIDYADNLAPVSGIADRRDQINTTWKKLRALSQRMHCLVVTATQSDAAAYKVYVQTRTNFGEDNRKLSEVTALYGINQTDEEKRRGLVRYNAIVVREDEFFETECVHVGGTKAMAAPAICSVF